MEESRGEWVAPVGSGFSVGSPSKKLGGGASAQMGGMHTSLSGHSSPSKFQGSTSKVGFGAPVTDSAMIEKEKQALERIKLKQQKEIEQMMEHEKQQQTIRERNEKKMQQEREREESR